MEGTVGSEGVTTGAEDIVAVKEGGGSISVFVLDLTSFVLTSYPICCTLGLNGSMELSFKLVSNAVSAALLICSAVSEGVCKIELLLICEFESRDESSKTPKLVSGFCLSFS